MKLSNQKITMKSKKVCLSKKIHLKNLFLRNVKYSSFLKNFLLRRNSFFFKSIARLNQAYDQKLVSQLLDVRTCWSFIPLS